MNGLIANIFLAGTLSVLATDVEVKPLTGSAVTGQLQDISADNVVVKSSQGEQKFAIDDLRYVKFEDPYGPGEFKPSAWLELIDGTSFAADSFVVAGNEASAQSTGGQPISVPTRSIRWVRFRKQQEQLQQQWDDILRGKYRGDLLIVRKSPASIDYLEGTTLEVNDRTVKFTYQGSEVDAPREKLEGLLFFHPLRTRFKDPVCIVSDVHQNKWVVKSLSVAGKRLKIETSSGISTTLSMDHISKIDFSTGNLVFLSDLEPESIEWKPYVSSRVASERLTKLYLPKKDRSLSGRPLRLEGHPKVEKGLSIHRRTEMVYRLTNRYRRFRAVVGLDDEVGRTGNVDLVISGDGKTLYTENISGTDKPRTLDVDITGVRRLKILVDYGKGMDLADHLNLCDAMLVQ